jgi:hypothetical protein
MEGAAADDPFARAATQLYGYSKEERLARYKEKLKQAARAQLHDYIDQARKLGTGERRNLEERVHRDAQLTIADLILERSRLAAIIQSGYFAALSDLKRDMRIFTATNTFAFLLLVLVSFLRPDDVLELFVPGMLLLVSTLVCAYLYVFGQNWLLTIINGDYMGFAYGSWLAIVFLFLCDIGLNRARVTTTIIDGTAAVIGSAVS